MVKNDVQALEPKEQLRNTLEGARMVLPGVQALFGFQLIAVFQPQFGRALTEGEARLHLLATALTALAAALTIAPASLHRRAEPDRASERLVRLSSALLTLGMWPLALAVSLDFGLVARVLLKNEAMAWGLAGLLLGVYFCLWMLLPWVIAGRSSASAESGQAAP